MKSERLIVGAVSLIACCASVALAGFPHDQIINYYLRKTPTDPESDITYTISLEITAVSTNGSEVGWEVVEVTVDEANSIKNWHEHYPELITSDGLWWVEHNDPDEPEGVDFIYPPTIVGTANTGLVSGYDMDYDMQTISSCSGCDPSMYGGRVAFMSYTLNEGDDPDPEDEDDGPVESDPQEPV